MKKAMFLSTAPIAAFMLMTFIAGAVMFTSCSKKSSKDDEKHCPIIAATSVPQAVKDSFAVRYPSQTVNTWFQKDNTGYCAYFITAANQKKLAEFTTTGSFIKEEIDMDNDNDFEDSTGQSGPKIPGACECDTPERK